MGIGVGLISGIHRYFLGDSPPLPVPSRRYWQGARQAILAFGGKNENPLRPVTQLAWGIDGSGSDASDPCLNRSVQPAFRLVEVIAFPMIVVNGLGMLLFMLIIQNIVREQEKTRPCRQRKRLRLLTGRSRIFVRD